MVLARKIGILVLGWSILGAQAPAEDPVMKARTERAKAQGLAEGDLPPLPRGIVEPPPLPPPETHVKDTRGGGRVAVTRRHGKVSRTTKAAKAAKATKTSKHPAKGGRKSHKRVKA